jgi:hypothetical protein
MKRALYRKSRQPPKSDVSDSARVGLTTPRTTGSVAARASEEAPQRGNSAPGGLALYIGGSFHGANPLTQHRWARAASPLRPTVRDWSSKIPNLVVSPQGAFSFYRLSALTRMPTARHKMLSCSYVPAAGAGRTGGVLWALRDHAASRFMLFAEIAGTKTLKYRPLTGEPGAQQLRARDERV